MRAAVTEGKTSKVPDERILDAQLAHAQDGVRESEATALHAPAFPVLGRPTGMLMP
ncbi:hypothetical protein [Streptomyces sp. NBC_00154]|uniref:hypothetical protein n=1 Tax=Streptomyces sp. NBC_00154 TaxID=2975670 RepID=UPI0022581929|nr:hypothetical protein [Streptomyces sp. NBC_00154]MCX5314190.1 hypothetical protein [Streptomyces sp. NBC_00154]